VAVTWNTAGFSAGFDRGYGPPAARSGGAGGRRRRGGGRYPRRVYLDGAVSWARNAREERELLEAYRKRVEAQAIELALEEAPANEVARARVRVVRAARRVERVEGRAVEWLEQLRAEDEEILIALMH
jgi:hypothetical protein